MSGKSTVPEFEALITPKRGRTLIVGSRVYNDKEDRRLRYADALGVDLSPGDGVDLVADLETEAVGTFAHIECMSVLEHCRRPWLMAWNLEQMLVPRGTILVTVPFIWRVHGYPDDYWRFTLSGIKLLFTGIDWTHCAYHHRKLCEAQDIPAVKDNDWPHFARTEACAFGMRK